MLSEVTTPLAAGETLDHYRLEAEVARGGMSTLFRATDVRNGRRVAVKVPHPEMEADPVLIERFRREEEIGQELDHPGIVKTYDGEDRSRRYMVIEWVEGRLLRAILNEERPAAHRSRGQAHARHLRRARHHAQARRGAPRPEAGKHHGRRSRPHQDHRFRHRHEGRRAAHHACHGDACARHARLHLARAGEGPARRPAQRRIRAGRHAVRDAHRPAAVCGLQSAGRDERAPTASIPSRRAN